MANKSKGEIEGRRTRVMQALVAGRTYAEIMESEQISDVTLWRDLTALHEDIAAWNAEERNRALSMAIANYKRVIDTAWDDHEWEKDREERWLAGEFDRSYEVPDPDSGTHVERKPPNYRTNKNAYLTVVANATRDLCKLAGLLVERSQSDVTMRGTVTQQHETESLDDAFNRIADPAERAAFIERVRAADEAARLAEEALGNL